MVESYQAVIHSVDKAPDTSTMKTVAILASSDVVPVLSGSPARASSCVLCVWPHGNEETL